MSERRGLGRASRAVVAELDQRIAELERGLEPYEVLRAERDRLVVARDAVTGERTAQPSPRVSQDQVAEFLEEHPGSLASAIAAALDTRLGTISAHLYRGNGKRFERREDGWHVIAAAKPGRGA